MAKRTRHQWQAGEGDEPDVDNRVERPSRGEKKRQAERLTELGARLPELGPSALGALGLDPAVLAAVETCRGLKRGSARARQLRRIGKLLRQHQTEELLAALDALD